MDNRFQMEFFGCQTRKTFVHIKTHLMSEYADGTRTRAVAFLYAFSQHAVEQV